MLKSESAGGIVVRNGLVLLVKQNGFWFFPKGHIETGETRLEAAKREIYEESGVAELEFIKELGSYKRYRLDEAGKIDKNELKTIFMFLFKTNQKALKPIDPEHPEAKWVPKNKVVESVKHPKDKKFFLSIIDEI